MSLTFTWPCRLCLCRVLCMDATATSFPLSKHAGGGDTAPAFSGQHIYFQFTWEVILLPSPVEFSSLRHSHKLSCSWLLGSCSWLLGSCPCSRPLRPSLACLFTVLWGIPLPSSSVLRVPHPLCNVSLLFLLLITQFLFFPWVGIGLSRGLCWSGQGCLWEYYVLLSSPCLRLPKLSGHRRLAAAQGALLFSPFNVKWRFSAQAGGVEGSKFCLFSVVLPARCVSSVSPGFHFRRYAFCFLPLAIILENPRCFYYMWEPYNKN
jgi:hypothetical protein